jgi:predicted transcriptional regulator/predicted phosphodiesterase
VTLLEDAMAEHEEVLGLAAQIVSAHVSNNAVVPDQLPGLIQQVFNALASVEQATATPPEPKPAVTVKQSVTAGHIVCLDCGKHFSMLRRHLQTDHQMTPEQYRQRWELPPSYPLVAPNYAKTRSALAKKIGLGRKGAAPKKTERKAARKTAAAGSPMQIAVIADIHGNMPALEAVLADIQRRGVDRTINLGDCVSGPLWPREVCDLLMASSGLVIRGNHDRWVSGPDPASMGLSDRYAYSNLGADHRHWLGALATSADAGNGILACHGTPTNDNQYLIEEVSEHQLVRAHPSTIRERLGEVQARVVLCGPRRGSFSDV